MTELLSYFFLSFASLFLFRKIAKKINLVDQPNNRKRHKGTIPLVGGISISSCYLIFLYSHPGVIPSLNVHALSIALLVIMGTLDDKFSISIKIRLLIEILVTTIMFYIGGIKISMLGSIPEIFAINLDSTGYVITVIFTVGMMNAFNMMDGLDGLLGAISITILTSLLILFYHYNEQQLTYTCIILLAIVAPYLLLNLGIVGRRFRIFMGDAGSLMLGFTIIWYLGLGTQIEAHPIFRPITALWLISLPLMDMVTTVTRRMLKGNSPFHADRTHIHHTLTDLGLSDKQSLLAISLICLTLNGIGLWGEIQRVSEGTMFYLFLIIFGLYVTTITFIRSKAKI